MAVFSYTQSEYDEYQKMLGAWADTLVTYDDRQCFGTLADDYDDGVNVCAMGALVVAAMERKPQHAAEIFDYADAMPIGWQHDVVGGSFVMELIARNACRQNDISPAHDTLCRYYSRSIPWLNDSHNLTFVQFASAVRATMAQIAEMAEIIPDPVPETTPERIEV